MLLWNREFFYTYACFCRFRKVKVKLSVYSPLKHIGVGRVLEVKLHLFSNMELDGSGQRHS